MFIPTTRPFVAGNKVLDDPGCGCAQAAGAAPPDDRLSLELDAFITRLLSTTTFQVATDDPAPDRAEVVRQTLLALESVTAPTQSERPERVGITDLHGKVAWLAGPEARQSRSRVILLSVDCNAPVRNTLAVPEDVSDYPLLAVTPNPYVDSGHVSVFLDSGGQEVEYVQEDLEVRADARASAAWALIDFSHFRGGGDSWTV